jgi:hypothetical protein
MSMRYDHYVGGSLWAIWRVDRLAKCVFEGVERCLEGGEGN